MTDAAELVELAAKAAKSAGSLARERRIEVDHMPVAATKSSPTDVVTASDTAAERLIRTQLRAARPDDAILGEEGGHSNGDSGVVWIVDPIDGTVNYLYGIQQYAVSIAVEIGGVVEGGVVHNPASDETWTAVRGVGAWLNDRPIHVTECADLSQALVGTGFSYDQQRRAHQARVLADLLPRVRDIRRMGAAALDLVAVASSRLDAYFEHGIQRWDYAAGALIAAEAGAVVRDPHSYSQGDPDGADMVFAAAPGVAEDLLVFLAQPDPRPHQPLTQP
jgi:myo-inositol-1(or 4)-monophosphatase